MNSPSHLLALEHTAVRPNHWTNSVNHRASIISISRNSVLRAFGAVGPNHWASSANRRASIISISLNSVFQLTLFRRLNTQQFDPIQHRASIISISWNSVFQLTLPFTGVWTHSRVAVRPNYWTNSANRRASIISISWNSVFELTLSSHLLAFEHTAVQPNHWTNSAKHRASIISISWNSVFQLTLPYTRVWTHPRVAVRRVQRTAGRASSASAGTPFLNSPSHLLAFEHTAVRPNPTQGEHHQHQLELCFSTHAPIYARLDTPQGSSSTQSLGEFSEPQGEHHQHQLELRF